MVFNPAADRETPDGTLLTSYRVERMGKDISVYLEFGEVKFLTLPPQGVTTTEDRDADGLTDALTLAAVPDSDYVGVEVALEDGTPVGTVAAVEGADPAPITLVLAAGTDVDLTGQRVTWRVRTRMGTPAYRLARGGRRWTIQLSTARPDDLALLAAKLGAALYAAVAQVMTQMGMAPDPAALQGAVAALAAAGENMDSYLSANAEQLEQERQAGQHPSLAVHGDAPRPLA